MSDPKEPPATSSDVEARMSRLRVLRSQLAANLNTAKSRGDTEDAGRMRAWLQDVAAEYGTLSMQGLSKTAKRLLDPDWKAANREELIQRCVDLGAYAK